MFGEEASGSGSGSGGGAVIPYDYSSINTNKNDRNANRNKPPMFNGDPEMFSWWKTKMYSHIMGMNDELWDILEDGVGSWMKKALLLIGKLTLLNKKSFIRNITRSEAFWWLPCLIKST